MRITLNDVVAVAVIVPVTSLLAVWAARHFGRWVLRSLQQSFGQVVVEVMAPDMAHLATKVTHAVDELARLNATEHKVVYGRLSDVEKRLLVVESKLGIRSPDARTRATDPPGK